MVKIFIDTNKYLDFYRYKEENLEILNELVKCNDIIIIEQIIDEFYRNRNKELNYLKEKIHELNCKVNSGSFNIEPIGIYSEKIKIINTKTIKCINEIKSGITNFEEMIINIINSEQEDIVKETFEKIIKNKKTIIYKHNDNCYEKAIRRNKLGGIPRSEKSGFHSLTVCDEYIWETLLYESKFDLCFVTRDKTYLENKDLLETEYHKVTGKKIIFVDAISDGLSYLGTNISKYASEVEHINTYDFTREQTIHSGNVYKNNLNNFQQDIFNTALSLAKDSIENKEKKVLMVEAAAGCGKTTIASNLLMEFIIRKYKATFVTSNNTSRNQFYEKIKGEYRTEYIKNLVCRSSAFTKSDLNEYDCLIVDDANSLHLKSGLFQNLGENQIEEIIKATYFSIFFVNPIQYHTLKDIGTIDLIKNCSEKLNADITIKKLSIAYCIGNSPNYLT